MTIDKRHLPARSGQLPAFTPVPRQRQRHDGWTDERQHNFIAALADTGSAKPKPGGAAKWWCSRSTPSSKRWPATTTPL